MAKNKEKDVVVQVDAAEPVATETASVDSVPELDAATVIDTGSADEVSVAVESQIQAATEPEPVADSKELDAALNEYLSFYKESGVTQSAAQPVLSDTQEFDDLDDPSQKRIKELEKHIAELRAKTEEFGKVARQTEIDRRERAFMNSLYKTYPDLGNRNSDLFKEFQAVFNDLAGGDPTYQLNPKDTLVMVRVAKRNLDRIKSVTSEATRRSQISNAQTLPVNAGAKNLSRQSDKKTAGSNSDRIDPKYVEMAKSGRFVRH